MPADWNYGGYLNCMYFPFALATNLHNHVGTEIIDDEDDLDSSQWPNFYYSTDTFAKLQTLKASIDPQNLFRWPQSIPLPS